MVSVLFVCLGNICRSPAAAGLLRHLHEKKGLSFQLQVDSSGIGDWYVGRLSDERMQKAAKERGVLLVGRAKQFQPTDFERFDYILAADHVVLKELYRYADSLEKRAKVHLMTEYSSTYYREEIPDPYHEGAESFDLVLDMLQEACEGLLEHIKSEKS